MDKLLEMKKIIVLFGRGEIGKTRTLRMVVDKLEEKPLSYSIADIRTVIQSQEKKVVVTTWGDNEGEILENIAYMRKNEPFDVAITAARTYGKTHAPIEAYAKEIGCDILWFKKTFEEGDERIVNERYADKIVDMAQH